MGKINSEELIDLYVNQRLTTREVGSRLGVSKTTVRRHLLKMGVPIRDAYESRKYDDYAPPTKEELHRLYFIEKLSFNEIAKRYGVNFSTVGIWLKKHDMKARRYGEGARKKDAAFKAEVFSLVGDEYTVLGEYVRNYSKIEIRHNVCGTVFDMPPTKFLRGNRCPLCSRSKGEKAIRDYLVSVGIDFKQEVSFPDCRNIEPLRFDFGVYSNGKLVCLIEYNGIQHYKDMKFFGGSVDYKYRRRNDEIKKAYCTAKGIPLIVIPYYADDAIEVLATELRSIHSEVVCV